MDKFHGWGCFTLLIAIPKLGHAGFVDYFDEPIKAEGTEQRTDAGGV